MVPSAYFLSLHIYHSLWCQNRSPEGAAAPSRSCQLSPYPGQGHRAVPQDQLCCEVHEPLPTLLLPLTQQVSLQTWEMLQIILEWFGGLCLSQTAR